jgi:hypothetical protein
MLKLVTEQEALDEAEEARKERNEILKAFCKETNATGLDGFIIAWVNGGGDVGILHGSMEYLRLLGLVTEVQSAISWPGDEDA